MWPILHQIWQPLVQNNKVSLTSLMWDDTAALTSLTLKKKSLVSVRGISHSSCKNHVNLNLWNDNKKPSPLHKKKTLQKKRSSDKNHPCTGSYLVETHDILRRTASKDWGENRFLREMGLVSGLRVANAGQNGTDLTRWAAVVCLDLPSTLDRLRGFLFLPTKDTNK